MNAITTNTNHSFTQSSHLTHGKSISKSVTAGSASAAPKKDSVELTRKEAEALVATLNNDLEPLDTGLSLVTVKNLSK